MNLEEINLTKLKELKLNDLINRKNEDRMTLVDTILSTEKSKFSKGKLTDEWINKRWFELKITDYKNLLEIYVDDEL